MEGKLRSPGLFQFFERSQLICCRNEKEKLTVSNFPSLSMKSCPLAPFLAFQESAVSVSQRSGSISYPDTGSEQIAFKRGRAKDSSPCDRNRSWQIRTFFGPKARRAIAGLVLGIVLGGCC